jgi:hypothetical protein
MQVGVRLPMRGVHCEHRHEVMTVNRFAPKLLS